MIDMQATKFVSVTPPAAIIDNASATTGEIDTLGWDYCTIYVYLGATDIAMGALKVQESDTSGSGFADITGASFAAALPGAGDDNGAFGVFIRCGGSRKRYLDVVATCGDGSTGTYITIFAILSRGEIAPDTATERGLTGQLIVN